MLKLLVELLGSSCKNVVDCTLRLTHLLMLRYEWRVSFATEGGVKAILSCMEEHASNTAVQQLALAVRNTRTQTSAGRCYHVNTRMKSLPAPICVLVFIAREIIRFMVHTTLNIKFSLGTF